MEKIYFSAATLGFYPAALRSEYEKGTGWPNDAVEITAAEHQEFIQHHPAGKILGADDLGLPAWVDIPPLSAEQLKTSAEQKKFQLRAAADSEIAWRQDAVDEGIATEEEAADLSVWRQYRVMLMRVDTANPEWPVRPDEVQAPIPTPPPTVEPR